MTARADWHLQSVALPDEQDDPFSAPIEEIGERIDLRDPAARFSLRVKELLRREASLERGGVTCPIKNRIDSCCHACPMSEAHSPESALGLLCRVGREQESVSTELAILAWRDQ